MSTATTDLSDAHPEAQVAEPLFADFGGVDTFHGSIQTLKVFEDNALVRATLETPGEGRVLVVDGGGSTRCALVGYVRDVVELAQHAVGIKALGSHPRKSEKGLHSAHAGRVVSFAGVTFKPGAWLYADGDGIVVADSAIHQAG